MPRGRVGTPAAAAVGAIERGRQNITLEAALKIAGALGLSLTELLAQETA